MKKVVLSTLTILFLVTLARAQAPKTIAADPSRPNLNLAPLRNDIISYPIRELADARNLKNNEHYMPIHFTTENITSEITGEIETAYIGKLEIPYVWLDRDVFLRAEGFSSFDLIVNNVLIGYSEDSRMSSEFDISRYIVDGNNTIIIVAKPSSAALLETTRGGNPIPSAYLISQPKTRIHDYNITFVPDSVENCGVFTIDVILSNSYNSDEDFSFGYDVYSPQKKLEHFDMREVSVKANSVDTVTISQKIWRTPGNEWSADKPGLYYGMLIIKVGNRMVEYVPYVAGYGETQIKDGIIYRNGKPLELKVADYTSTADRKSTVSQLLAIKKKGFNTLHTYYPQPEWFYEECSKAGLYVIDRANIYAEFLDHLNTQNRKIGGTLANNPEWLNTFLSRVERMQIRSNKHVCIIGWSLGGIVGNGFNMYKSYQLLKELDDSRAVIFNDAQGEWNSDMSPISSTDYQQLISK